MVKEEKTYIKEFYTLEQLSKEINFNVQSLRKFIKEGKLKASVIGNRYVVKRDSVIAWLDENQVNNKQS